MVAVLHYLKLVVSNFPRACFTGFLFNFASYFYWLVVPLLCADMGGSTFQLSLLQTVAFVIYSFISPICGKLGDKLNPYILIRIAMLFFVAAVLVILIFRNVFICLYVSVALWPFCTAFYWPVTTGTVGFESPLGCENRNTSLYQVSWSIGKALGFLFGGILKGALGTNALYICIAIVAVNMVVYPYRHPKWVREKIAASKKKGKKDTKDINVNVTIKAEGDEVKDVDVPTEVIDAEVARKSQSTGVVAVETEKSEEVVGELKKLRLKWNSLDLKNKTYIYVGYIMQLGIYGTSAILSNSYVKLAQDKGITIPIGSKPVETYIGVVFFCYFIAQTIVMILMSLTIKWIYKRSLIMFFQVLYISFLIVLALSDIPYLNWVFSLLGGFAGGFAYQTSTYYSMRASEASKSMFMGISECVGGLGNALLPLVSGLLCTFMDDNYIQIYIAIIVIIFCIILEEVVYHVGYFINNKRQAKRADPNSETVKYDETPIEMQTVK